ncbi:probable methyltransferase PMT27 [Mercurialis annua]|uniref:probable methyltransferase PMT27 n=1 Tax=Mercurialis annua TaxID=3986 RepID=UPI00215FD26F|nr:probable methyltransferase PMT27 [Mercurialis annua]
MPLSRSRNSKRSSSSSYTSTITTIAFIAVCVIGVWMLTSTSVIPPQTTNRAAKVATSATSNNNNNGVLVDNVDASSATNEAQNIITNEEKKDQPPFEDNPGDLPADAIINADDPKTNANDQNKPETGGGGEHEKEKRTETRKQVSEESTMTQNQQAEQTSNESSESDKTINEESNTSHEKKSSSESGENSQDDSKDQQQDIKESNKNSQETQSHESNADQEQQQQETQSNENNQEPEVTKSFDEQQQQQRQEDAGIQNTSQETQNEVSEEDQQQRMKQQQQQQQQQQEGKKQDEMQQHEKQKKEQKEHQFEDVTTPGDKKSDNATDTLMAQLENPHSEQESQGESSSLNQDTKATEDKPSTESSISDGETSSGIPKESKESKKSWSTQAAESENQKERRKDESDGKESIYGYTWHLCNVTAGSDYIPCLDNEKALKQLRTTGHFEHRERHCPEEGPTCLVRLPEGYKRPISWPSSRDKIWYHNVPHTKLAEVKGHQNWVKVTGEFLTFPGGGTQFIHGALHYIEFLQQAVPNIAWGKHTRVILDVGCGVASFGGYLFEKDVLTMSFAPKDEHEAQVQFALERGIPAISAVMGSQRLPFPSRVFDLLHCARCRVPWHADGGQLLLELNRVLRPGGYFVWSATPVYQKLQEDVEIWQAMSALTVSMCWELITIKKDKLNSVGAAIYRKPLSNDCYDQRKKNTPPMCKGDDDPNAAWYVPLQSCMHRVPVDENERGTRWPEDWPNRIQTPPYWINSSQMGIYGKPAPQDFTTDYEHWKHVIRSSYLKGLGISWSNVRNVMDMRAVYGGFAAALKDLKVWVLNVVNIDSPDTLPIIYERGLFGIYHDWCESFSTYPRTYDLLHADHLFSKLKKRCKLAPVMAEIDRIVRPGGKLVVRDESSTIGEVENLLKSMRWEVHLTFSKDQEGLLSAQKGDWRPQTFAASSK